MLTQFLTSFSPLAARYDAFILDLWGVMHDGQQLYPGAKECLEALRAQGKKIIFLSNAPRRASVAAEVLAKMGIAPDQYDSIITSGETAYRCLADPHASFFVPPGRRYFYIGLEKDRGILSGLDFEEAPPETAHFLLLAHSFVDNQPMSEITQLLMRCLERRLPALCINPDTEVVRISGGHVYCAGLIAEEYRAMGGEVIYFGKPHRTVYESCFAALPEVAAARILAVGDNIATDIKGAQASGLDSALITGGVLKQVLGRINVGSYEAKCSAVLKREGVFPEFVLPSFAW